jgi:hypothetical protein
VELNLHPRYRFSSTCRLGVSNDLTTLSFRVVLGGTPVPPARLSSVTGLEYFPISLEMRVRGLAGVRRFARRYTTGRETEDVQARGAGHSWT